MQRFPRSWTARGNGAFVSEPYLMCYEAHCCVLIQEPPRDDPDRLDRLKDNLGTLLRGAEARRGAIEATSAMERQSIQVEQLILRSHEVFKTFEKNIGRQNDKVSRAINLLTQDLRRNLGIPPGDQKSIRLNMDMKKFEDALKDLFKGKELIDPAFMKNISRVAQGIEAKNKNGEP